MSITRANGHIFVIGKMFEWPHTKITQHAKLRSLTTKIIISRRNSFPDLGEILFIITAWKTIVGKFRKLILVHQVSHGEYFV